MQTWVGSHGQWSGRWLVGLASLGILAVCDYRVCRLEQFNNTNMIMQLWAEPTKHGLSLANNPPAASARLSLEKSIAHRLPWRWHQPCRRGGEPQSLLQRPSGSAPSRLF